MSGERRLNPWDTFFFAPQSTSPMTLVRVAWGAVTAVWAVSLLPDIDPFFTEGDLLYERSLQAGSCPVAMPSWSRPRAAPCRPGHWAAIG